MLAMIYETPPPTITEEAQLTLGYVERDAPLQEKKKKHFSAPLQGLQGLFGGQGNDEK